MQKSFNLELTYIYIYFKKRERERGREPVLSTGWWFQTCFIFPFHKRGMSSFPNHRPQHGPGLWDLASAAGQRVNFAALENKVVAVDAA